MACDSETSAMRRGGVLARVIATVAMLIAALSVFAMPAKADPTKANSVKGEVSVRNEDGYVRLVFRFDEEVDARVRVSGAVMIISFSKPIDVAVDRMNVNAPDYISAARRDPDGKAIRIALAKQIKFNTMPAAEKLFIDLLPEKWSGVPPGLPQDVVEELARRAREAERKLRRQSLVAIKQGELNIRVKVALQPTFVRYVFTLPDIASVEPRRGEGELTLRFDRPIVYDLADAKATMPPTVQSIDTGTEAESTAVQFKFSGAPEVRTFREDHAIVVDVGTEGPIAKSAAEQTLDAVRRQDANSALAIAPPQTVPADGGAKASAVTSPPLSEPPSKAATPSPPASAAAQTETAVKPGVRIQAAGSKIEPLPAAKSPEGRPVEGQPAAANAAEAKPVEVKPAETKPAAEAKPAETKPAAEAKPPEAKSAEAKPAEAEAPAAVKPAPAVQAEKPVAPAMPKSAMRVALAQQGDGLRLTFPYGTPTAAAVFRRGETLWLVFDSDRRLDVAALDADSSQTIRGVAVSKGADGETIVRLKLARPRLIGLAAEGAAWAVTIADNITDPTQPLQVARSIVGRDRSNITIPFQNPQRVHRIVDPDVGDKLLVVTAMGPARGFLKPQDFLELRAIGSTQGIAIQPLADDLAIELAADKVVITRPGGLTLSTSGLSERNSGKVVNPQVFDTQTWGFDREAPYNHRQSELIAKAAASPDQKKRTARIDLVRFYLARGMIPEAMGVLNVTLADERKDDVTGTVLHAVTNVLLNRPNEALKDLSMPRVGNQYDAPVWRAVAYARQGKWPEARELFKKSEASIATLPIELQRIVMLDAMRASIETRDFAGAGKILNDFETIGVPHDLQPSLALLIGRLNEGLGRKADALAAYRNAADSRDRRAAAQGRLRELVLHTSLGDIEKKDVIDQLESLTATWRGDETEVEGLQILAHLYTEAGRYRDAFHTMRTALLAHPNSELTRKIQDEAAATFDSLFLSGKGDAMPAIEALGLFYDYRELTPIGRRGDEMIRRLADRLVAVDLLEQAAELLQHQVDHRLQGAARAQVATRLATVYLMDHKADRALAALRRTRTSDLSTDLRNQRLLLEARALSDTGRHELALEVIANMKSREAERLRGDILWSAKKWRAAAEQIELFYGDRWKQFAPLTADERVDILRAAIGYAMAEESIGLARFRDKYAAKMAEGPERRSFAVVTAPIGTGGPEFQQIANAIATANTLDAFLRDMKKRYPDKAAGADAAVAPPATEKDAASGKPAGSALPPKSPAAAPKSDPTPTGSISRQIMRRARASAR